MSSRLTYMEKYMKSEIQNVMESRIIQQLLKRKSKLKPKDPLQTNLFVICQENTQIMKKKSKAKSQRNDNKLIHRSLTNQNEERGGTQVKKHKKNFSNSQSVELPSLYRKFEPSNKSQLTKQRIKTKQINNQIYETPKNSLKSRNIIAHYTNQDRGFQQSIKKNKRFLTLNTQQLDPRTKTQARKKPSYHIKLNSLKLQRNNALKILKQWKQIDILKLQTYFIKLKKSKKSTNLSQSKIQNNKQISTFRNCLPEHAKISEFIKNYKPTNIQINIDNLVRNEKFGVIFQQNLSLYFGEVKDEKKSGLGIYICSNFRFQGICKGDQKLSGYQITLNGYYKGTFKDNKRHGQGEYLWQNGESYSGQWVNGVKNGSGVWKSGKGDSYIGQWINGKVEGYGVHITSTGQRYQGQFKSFLKDGSGKQTFPNGDVYKGQYQKGNPHGRGLYTWKNNITFQGQFRNGYREGHGLLIASNYLRLAGNFSKDLPNGEGILTFDNGDQYTGTFKNGEKHGEGILKLKKQHKILTGKWEKNQFLYQQKQQNKK